MSPKCLAEIGNMDRLSACPGKNNNNLVTGAAGIRSIINLRDQVPIQPRKYVDKCNSHAHNRE